MSGGMSDEEELVLSETTETLAELVGSPLDVGRVVRPGDHLVVSVEKQITDEERAALRDDLIAEFPGLANVTVMGGPVRFEFVYRDDEDQP